MSLGIIVKMLTGLVTVGTQRLTISDEDSPDYLDRL